MIAPDRDRRRAAGAAQLFHALSRAARALALATTLLLPGCGEGGSRTDVAGVVEVLDEENAIYRRLCACPAAFGRPDAETCFRGFVARDDAQEQCVRDLFAANADELADVVLCQRGVIVDAHACLDAVVACDGASVLACAVDGRAAADACGAYPANVTAGLAACYGT